MKYNTTHGKFYLHPVLLKKILLTFIGVFALFYGYSQATITSTVTGGPWNSTTTWIGGVIPSQGSNDNVVIASGATVTIPAAASCVNLTINGNLTMANSGFKLSIGNPGSGVGSLTLGAGSNLFIGSANTVEFVGTQTGVSLTNNGGTIASTGTNGADGGTVQFDGNGGGHVNIGGSTQTKFYNLDFLSNASLDFGATTPSIYINGTFTIPNNNWGFGANPKSPIYGPASTLYLGSTQAYSVNGTGNYQNDNGHYEWASTAGAIIGTTPGYPNNVILNTSTCCTTAGTGVGNIAGSLTIKAGQLDFSGVTNPLVIGGSINIQAGADASHINNLIAPTSDSIDVAGNWTRATANTKFTQTATGSVVFDGGGTSTITGPTTVGGETEINNLTVNNATNVVLASSVTIPISGIVTLTAGGKILTSSTNVLQLNNTTTAAITGNGTSYIDGPLAWSLSATTTNNYTFPVGQGTSYLPFSVKPNSSSSATIATVQAFNTGSGGTADGTTVTAGSLSTTEYWSLSTTSPFTVGATIGATSTMPVGTTFNALAESSTKTGTYSAVGGTPSGNSITSATIGNSSPAFFSFASAPLAIIFVSSTNITCNGSSGSITVAGSGGVSPYHYSIDGGAYMGPGATWTFNTLSAGKHGVTVKDNAGTISKVDSITVLTSLIVSASDTICLGSSATLTAQNTVNTYPVPTYSWTASPAAGAGLPGGAGTPSAGNASVSVMPTAGGVYVYTVTDTLYNNVLPNPGFEQGNTIFGTNYSYQSTPYVFATAAGYPSNHNGIYTIGSMSQQLCTLFGVYNPPTLGTSAPPTNGGGEMFICDGPNGPGTPAFPTPNPAWTSGSIVIPVNPGTDYYFSYYGRGLGSTPEAQLQASVVDNTGATTILGTQTLTEGWVLYRYKWNSGISTSVKVELSDLQNADVGNDFALDNMGFATPCPVTNTITVTVTSLPSAGAVSAPHTICSGQNLPADLTLSGNTGNVTKWQSSPNASFIPATDIANTTTTLTAASIGAVTTSTYYRAVVNSCSGPLNSTSVLITVAPSPTTADAGGDKAICTSSNTILAANTPLVGTASWSIASGPSTSLAQFGGGVTNPTATFTPAGGVGLYSLVWTISNGSCTSADTVIINVSAGISAGTLSYHNGGQFCSTDSTLEAPIGINPGGTFSSSPATGLSIDGSGNISPYLSATNDTHIPFYTVTYAVPGSGACPGDTISTEVIIKQLPTVQITYNSPFCQTNGGTYPVTLTGPTGGVFSVDSVGLNIDADGQVKPSASGPGSYMVTYLVAASGGCPAVSDSTTINIIPNPSPAIAKVTVDTICNLTSVVLEGNKPINGTGTWSVDPTSPSGSIGQISNVADSNAVFNPSGGPGNYNLVWSISNSPCNVTRDTVTVTVVGLPGVTIGNDATVCSNTDTTITFTGTLGAIVTYTINGGPNQTITLNAAGTASVHTGALTTAATYSLVSVTNGSGLGCPQTASGSATITVNSLPTATIGSDATICSGTDTTVTITGTPGTIVTYTINGGGNKIITLNAAGNGRINTGALTVNTTYALVSINTTATPGCPQALTDTTVITIQSLPAVTIGAGATICSGTDTTVTFSGTPGAIVTYTLNSGSNQTLTLNGAGNATLSTGILTANANYSLISVQNSGTPNCPQTAVGSAVIAVNQLPTATISGTITIPINTATTITFGGTPNAIITYTVNGGANQTINLDGSGNATLPTGNLAVTTTYSLISVALNTTPSCTQPAIGSAIVTVSSLPFVNISGTTTICSGGTSTIHFKGSPNATVVYTINGGADQTIILDGTGAATLPTGPLSTTTAYSLVSATVTVPIPDTEPATGTATVTVTPLPTVTIAGNSTICSGSDTTIIFSGSAGGTVTYTVNGGANQTITLNAAGQDTVSTGPLTANAVYSLVNVVLGACSQSQSGTVTVAVNDLPSVTIGNSVKICSGTDTTIVFSGTPNAIVTYTINGGANQTTTLDAIGADTITTAVLTANANYTLVSVALPGATACVQPASGNALIQIQALPTVTIGSDATICFGADTTVAFTGTPNATVTYTVNGGADQTVTLNIGGTHTLITPALIANTTYALVSVTNAGATSCPQPVTGSALISIIPPPTATISGSTTISIGMGATVTFGGTPNATVTYQINGGANQSIVLDAAGNVTLPTGTLMANTTYSLVSVALSGTPSCPQPANGNAIITVSALPLATISGTRTICSGGSAIMTFSGNPNGVVTYQVNSGADQTITLDGTGIATLPTGTLSATTVVTLVSISVTSPVPATNTVTDTAIVTVIAPPTASISMGSIICSSTDTTIVFNGTPGAIVTYTINGGSNLAAVLNAAGTDTVTTAILTSAATYDLVSVTSGDTSACSQPATGSATVLVNALPAATISGTTTICSGSGATITFNGTANAFVTYTINGGANQTILLDATGVATVGTGSLSATATYTLVSIALGATPSCPQPLSGSAIVTVTQLPVATISYASPICSSVTSESVNQTGTIDGTYSSTAGLVIDPVSGAIAPTSSLSDSNYTVTYTMAAGGGCALQTATTTVSITQLPIATIGYGSPYCSNDSISKLVTRTGTPGGIYSSTPGLTINAGTGAIDPSTSTAGIYMVTYTMAAGGGCSAQMATASVTINPTPVLTIKDPAPACSPAMVNIKADAVAKDNSYLPFTTNLYYYATQADIPVNNQLINPDPSAIPASGTYWIKAITLAGCSDSAYVNVVVNTPPSAPTTTNVAHCQFDNADPLTAVADSTNSLIWYAADGSVIDTPTPSTTEGNTTLTYYVAQSDGNCVSPRATLTVRITTMPTAIITIANPTQIGASDGLYLNNVTTTDSIEWTTTEDSSIFSTTNNPFVVPPYGASDVVGSGGITNPSGASAVATTYVLAVKSTENANCIAKASVTIVTIQKLVIPNIFSPNGTGPTAEYALWQIGNIEDYPQAAVTIFNRYGQFIYKSKPGYTDPWDGNYNGQPLPVGTYFYIITTTPNAKPIAGPVSIVR